MTEKQLRQKAVNCIAAWNGARQGSAKHKAIIDTYNAQEKLPSGYKMTYTDAWCAATVSAVALTIGMNADEFPTECSCKRMIALFKKLGLWEENDAYKPSIGDLVMYYWNDSADSYSEKDCTADPNHVGMVTAVNGESFTVTEGNKSTSKAVGTREMQVNGRYIRGFCLPDYKTAAKRLSKATTTTTSASATGSAVSAFKTMSVKLPVLKKGASGAPVEALQCLLLLHGYSCGDCGMDGSFGSDTNTALRKFQKEHSLAVDGSCGSATWTELIFN